MQTLEEYKISQIERKNQRTSAIITTCLYVLLFLLTFIWAGKRGGHILGVGAGDGTGGGEYQIIGQLDYGDGKEGSKDVNNFDPAVKNPTPSETPNPNASDAPSQPSTPATPSKEPPIITTNQNSPVNVKPTTTNTSSTTTTKPTNTTPKTNDDDLYQPNKGGGSNHGKGTNGETGNASAPDIKTLDPEGLYTFGTGTGTGGGGLNGRKPVKLVKPTYNVQEEGLLTYEFTVEPDGKVGNVKLVGMTNKTGIKNAGIDAIKKWVFTKLPDSAPQMSQIVRVTITFKLKD